MKQSATDSIASGRPVGSAARWRHFVVALGALLGFIVIASVGYRLIESEYTLLDAIYMTVISVSTVGYGEVGQLSDGGRIWTVFVIIVGLMTVAGVVGALGGMMVEGRIRSIFGRRQLERKISALRNHTIICGYGRLGAKVAEQLTNGGRDVVVIDAVEDRLAAAERGGVLCVKGDAQEEDVLEAAGIERAAVLIGALSTDPDNLFVTLSARQANPAIRIFVRAEQASSQRKLLKAGADRVVRPQAMCAERIAQAVLHPAAMELADMAKEGNLEFHQLQVSAGTSLAGKTLAEAQLPRRAGVQVAAIRHGDGQVIYQPGPATCIDAGDTLILIGESGSLEAVEKLQSEGSS